MSVNAIFRCGLLLAGFVLGASSVAEAKILQSPPPVSVPDASVANRLDAYLDQFPDAAAAGDAVASKTITLNFGPLHFQEVLKGAPKACRS